MLGEMLMPKQFGITKIMGVISAFFLMLLVIGFIVVPRNISNTTNYCFSDVTDRTFFEQKLKENKISFSQISDTTVQIGKENEEKADNIFSQTFE